MNDSYIETLTFLFTDIEGSTRLWEQEPRAMRAAIDRHNIILRKAISDQDGRVFRTVGDAIYASFHTAPQALTAAANAQRSLYAEEWATGSLLRVRVVLHTTEAEAELGDYVGAGLNRIGRLLGVCHGGQTLLTQATEQLVRDHLPDGVTLNDLGRHRFRDMVHPEEIFQLDINGLPADFPPLSSSESIPDNLSVQATPFIGRDHERAELSRLLESDALRLTTIVGPGGMGKTRLAVATAELQTGPATGRGLHGKIKTETVRGDLFSDGVFFVALAPLRSAQHIVTAVATAVGLQLEADHTAARTSEEQLMDYLKAKRLLLILDNFEHLLDGAGFVTQILENAPDVRLLVTSRERLHLRNEQVYFIDGLEFPAWQTPEDAAEFTAVQLFMQSARRVHQDFELQREDLAALTRICQLVRGMPLALELAAAWVDVLPLDEIEVELQQSLDFLETDMQDVPERQRSMRAVFDHSWQRLNETERDSLCRLSVFRGGFDRHAARQVAGTSIRSLSSLVAKSLMQVNADRDRYDVHELVRQYAEEELSRNSTAAADVHERHGVHYIEFLRESELELKGSGQLDAIKAIDVELENIRAALDWSSEQGRSDILGQPLNALCLYYDWRGRAQDGETTCRAAAQIALARSEPLLATRAMIWQATFAYNLGHRDDTSMLLSESERLLEEAVGKMQPTERELAALLMVRAGLSWDRGQVVEATSQLEESIALYERVEDRWNLSRSLTQLCYVLRNANSSGDARRREQQFAKAIVLAQRGLMLARLLDDRANISRCLYHLGVTLAFAGRFEEGVEALEESLVLVNALSIQAIQVESRMHLSFYYRASGRPANALRSAEEAVAIARRMGSSPRLGPALRFLAIQRLIQERFDEADRLMQESTAEVRKFPSQHQWALAYGFMALVDQVKGRDAAMQKNLKQSILTALESRTVTPFLVVIPLSARLLCDQGRVLRAVELDSLFLTFFKSMDARYTMIASLLNRPYLDAAAAQLPESDAAAAREHGRNLNLWETAEKLLVELEAPAPQSQAHNQQSENEGRGIEP